MSPFKFAHIIRPFIIGGVIFGVFAVIITGVLFIASRQSTVDTVDAISLLRDNITTIEDAETLFRDAQRRRITLETILNVDFFDETKTKINNFLNFQRDLLKVRLNKLSQSQKTQITELQAKSEMFASTLQQTLILYTAVYNAFNDGDSEYFNNLLNSDNQDITIVARRFADYFEFKDYWQNKLSTNNCFDVIQSQSEICIDAQAGYDNAIATFNNNTPAVQCLFSAYADDNTMATVMTMAMSKEAQQIIQEEVKDESL